MATSLTFRTPRISDAPGLAALGRDTFVAAFGHLYSAENLNLFLNQAYSEEAVCADLTNPDRLYHLAEVAGEMVGYCKLGFDASLDYDFAGRRGMELKQLYLLPSQHGSGLGTAFMNWTLDQARARDTEIIILSVWSGNDGAQRFYQRHGFRYLRDTIFMVGNHRDDEFIYGLELGTR
jgi:diamine N-acetyltransferase